MAFPYFEVGLPHTVYSVRFSSGRRCFALKSVLRDRGCDFAILLQNCVKTTSRPLPHSQVGCLCPSNHAEKARASHVEACRRTKIAQVSVRRTGGGRGGNGDCAPAPVGQHGRPGSIPVRRRDGLRAASASPPPQRPHWAEATRSFHSRRPRCSPQRVRHHHRGAREWKIRSPARAGGHHCAPVRACCFDTFFLPVHAVRPHPCAPCVVHWEFARCVSTQLVAHMVAPCVPASLASHASYVAIMWLVPAGA
jgi:hypothetical protein